MRALSLTAALVAALLASGASANDLHNRAEASMLVEGKALLNPDGSIESYSLREPEKLPAPVIELIKQNVASWKLKFIHTPTGPMEENLTMRVIATDVDRTHMSIRLVSAQFDDANPSATEIVRSNHRVAPIYPYKSLEGRVSGTAYVLVRVGPDGHVLEASAEQVNLYQYVDHNLQTVYRRDLASASVEAIKKWTFDVPSTGPSAGRPYWDVCIPVRFHLHQVGNLGSDGYTGEAYGSWEVYVRGPREVIPWIQDRSMLAEAPDSTLDDVVHQLGAGPTLATPLSPN